MKTQTPFAILALGSTLLFSAAYAKENPVSAESNNAALSELCTIYAEEDDIATRDMQAYLQECIAGMTDLSDSIQEEQPVVAEAARKPEVIKTVEPNTPEQMVQNELVNQPDPSAEQLSATQ